jgi:HSP20 family protein
MTENSMNETRLLDPFAMDPLEDTFRTLLRPWRFDQVDASPRIRLDVAEQNGAYAVRAEIPGARKEDIDVRIEGNLVTISAEMKKEWDDRKEGRLLRSERQYGYATRSFTLASPVDESKAGAKYENGVLELTLPKKSATATKRLTIQ